MAEANASRSGERESSRSAGSNESALTTKPLRDVLAGCALQIFEHDGVQRGLGNGSLHLWWHDRGGEIGVGSRRIDDLCDAELFVVVICRPGGARFAGCFGEGSEASMQSAGILQAPRVPIGTSRESGGV